MEILSTLLFGNTLFFKFGIGIWNFTMNLVCDVAGTTPQSFSSLAWGYIVNVILSFMMAIAGTLLNIFYMVGIIRQSTNLKENFTLEIFVENCLKMLLANILILNGVELIKMMFELASIGSVAFLQTPTVMGISSLDEDIGKSLFGCIFGILFFVVSLVCSATIFLTVYSRYLHLYLLVALYPVALSTMPGGRGVSSTASAWVRAFLQKCFEIMVIAILITIATFMCKAINFGELSGFGEFFDGFIQMLQNMATMVILSSAVKGADILMRRSLGL